MIIKHTGYFRSPENLLPKAEEVAENIYQVWNTTGKVIFSSSDKTEADRFAKHHLKRHLKVKTCHIQKCIDGREIVIRHDNFELEDGQLRLNFLENS